MSKSVEDYLKILYPNPKHSISEQKSLEKDRVFIQSHFDQFNERYDKHSQFIDSFGEREYLETILNQFKQVYDPETVISEYIQTVYSILNQDSYISTHFDSFCNNIKSLRKSNPPSNLTLPQTPITFYENLNLTKEFLDKIDSSRKLSLELEKLQFEGNIQLNNNYSSYNERDNIIHCQFNDTINSAHNLIHEFMHHLIEKGAQPSHDRPSYSFANEFLPIYYEKAFIKFLAEKDIISEKEAQALEAQRINHEFSRDPHQDVELILELTKKAKKGIPINEESITDAAIECFHIQNPDRQSVFNTYSKQLFDFMRQHTYVDEIVHGPIMYRFNIYLAKQSKFDFDTQQKAYKLLPFIKDTSHDHIFMEHYDSLSKVTFKNNNER